MREYCVIDVPKDKVVWGPDPDLDEALRVFRSMPRAALTSSKSILLPRKRKGKK